MTPIETAADILSVPTREAYERKFRRHLSRSRKAERPQQATLAAHINTGRWVTPCVCGGGIALHPEWAFAACFDCGRSWTALVFPDAATLRMVDTVLAERFSRPGHAIPLPFYSWEPGETERDLRKQNIQIAVTLARRARRHKGER